MVPLQLQPELRQRSGWWQEERRKMGTFPYPPPSIYAPPRRCGNVPPSFASLSTEPVSTTAMNDRGGLRFFRFAYRRIFPNRGVGVHRCASGHKNASASKQAFQWARLGLYARALSFGVCIYVHVLYARTRALESRRIPTRRASSCFLYRRAFFTANERIFGALITSAFYIIHGMEEDRGCENNRSWIIRMTMEEFRLYRWKEILINIRYFDRSYIYLFIY